MPKQFPAEFHRDVVHVARHGDTAVAQVARDFGISETALSRWMAQADVDEGRVDPSSALEAAELKQARARIRQLEQEAEVMRRAVGYLSRKRQPKMTYPLVADLAAEGIAVTLSCRILGFSNQAHYKWRANPISQRDWDDAHLINTAMSIHRDDPGFGSRFIADELSAAGVVASENRVWRLCSLQGLWSAHARKRGWHRRPGLPVHDDLIRRQFGADGPDRVWFTDLTEHPTAEGKLYLCAVKDAWSGRIVGHSMGARMTSALAVAALTNAITTRGEVPGCMVHSDRGGQFRSTAFVRALKAHQLIGSMGRVRACQGNAAMESFFSLLQKNVLNRTRWTNRELLGLAIVVWIERNYHRRRRQRRLGKLTPIEFETLHKAAQAA